MRMTTWLLFGCYLAVTWLLFGVPRRRERGDVLVSDSGCGFDVLCEHRLGWLCGRAVVFLAGSSVVPRRLPRLLHLARNLQGRNEIAGADGRRGDRRQSF